jgi:hypothetical protein
MDFTVLNDENFLIYAASRYYNPTASDVEDFYEDLSRIKYIKRLINRYLMTGIVSERLLLNHIIVIANSFTVPGALRIFEYKLDDPEYLSVVKPFMIYLNYTTEDWVKEVKSNQDARLALEKI